MCFVCHIWTRIYTSSLFLSLQMLSRSFTYTHTHTLNVWVVRLYGCTWDMDSRCGFKTWFQSSLLALVRSLTKYIFKFSACTEHSFPSAIMVRLFRSLSFVNICITVESGWQQFSLLPLYLLNLCSCFVLDPLCDRRYSQVVALMEQHHFFICLSLTLSFSHSLKKEICHTIFYFWTLFSFCLHFVWVSLLLMIICYEKSNIQCFQTKGMVFFKAYVLHK